jgi:hypothetical protein
LILPNHFEDPLDIQTLIVGIKECMAIAEMAPMKKVGAKFFSYPNPFCKYHEPFTDKVPISQTPYARNLRL